MVDVRDRDALNIRPALVPVTNADGGSSAAQAVVIVGSDGSIVTPGAGTEYTQDAALPVNPVGPALILRQLAAPADQGAANGDGIAWSGTNKGEAFVKDTDAATAIGATNEASAAADNSTSGLNGLIKRLLARLTVFMAQFPASLGSKAPSASLSVTPAGLEYETVAASQTAQVLGGTGATGDFLSHVIFQPTTTAAGTCTILDNATVIYTFTTGTLADLRPITVPVNAFSVSGAWKITTGANVTATAFGDFAA